MKPLSILVADDEDTVRDLIQQWLVREGHRVVGVAGADEARDAWAKQKFDLVITDVLMPDGDGLDLIVELKAAQPKARIVAISGGGRYIESEDCVRMARGLGAHAAALKPFTWPQLQAAMQQALAPAAVKPREA